MFAKDSNSKQMNSWSEEINNSIDSKLEGTKEKDIRFFRVEEFKRNVSRTDTFSTTCPFCLKQKIEIKDAVEKIEDAVHVPGKSRRNYDRLISRLSSHIRKDHGFYPPYYFSYLFSFFGLIAGAALGFILYKLIPEYSEAMAALGFIIGLFPAYFWGSAKDKKVRAEKKIM